MHNISEKNTSLFSSNRKSKKGGRPKFETHFIRSKTIGVRVNEEELKTLAKKSKIMGVTIAELLRSVALNKRLPSPPVPEVNRKVYSELMKLAVNLNQLSRLANMGKTNLPITLLVEIKEELRKIQAQIMGLGQGVDDS